jgi:hypothetical protein
MIKIGFIGVGFVAQQCHLPAFDSTPNCEITAISDLHPDLANKIGRRYEVPKVYYSHQDLLDDSDVEAVVITVPRPLTSGLCLASLKAGKKVFAEKPIALNSVVGKEIIETAQALNLPVQVGYMRRHDASVLETLKYLQNLQKQNHKPLLVRAHCYMGDSYCSPFGDFKSGDQTKLSMSQIESMPPWLTEQNINAYENYLNVFSHTLDLIGFLLSSKLIVKKAVLDAKAQGITLLENSSGTVIELSTAKCILNQWIEGISFVFPDQLVDVTLPPAFLKNVPGTLTIRKGNTDDSIQKIRPKWSWAFRNQASYFIEICHRWPKHSTNLLSSVEQVLLAEQIIKLNDFRPPAF